jgi:uncharacterized protein
MTPNEKSLIEDLFSRLRTANPGGRDTEAEAAITAEMARSPGAAYALVQTVLVQDQALREAHDMIKAAEGAPQPHPSFLERAGSALSGFGGPRGGPAQATQQAPGMQQARAPESGGAQGGGFMRSALQTAAGVAGGALLFEGVRSMFGGGGGLFGGGGGPWGSTPTTVNETIINENSDRNSDAGQYQDSRDDNADNVRDAGYDPATDDYDDSYDDGDDGSPNSGDDSWV